MNKRLIHRSLYEDKLMQYKSNGYIKVITGNRRAGKSSLLISLMSSYDVSEYIFIDMELYNFINSLNEGKDVYDYCKKHITNHVRLVCIDEIQSITGRETALISLAKEFPKIDFIITGSTSDLLSSELSTRLRGRYNQIHVYPFLFSEYCSYFQLEYNLDAYNSYLRDGGFPSLYEQDVFLRGEFLQGLLYTIFYRDIAERYKIKDSYLLDDLMLFLMNNIGNRTNAPQIAEFLLQKKLISTPQTLRQYLEYLKSAYLLYEVPLYDIRGKRIFDRLKKYYIADHALRNVMFGSYDPAPGKLLENIIYITAKAYGYTVMVGSLGDKEIDFVIEKGKRKIFIQVCYSLVDEGVIAREYDPLLSLQNGYEKRVVTLDNYPHGDREGIRHVSAWEFEDML